jgi:hypothetical protein
MKTSEWKIFFNNSNSSAKYILISWKKKKILSSTLPIHNIHYHLHDYYGDSSQQLQSYEMTCPRVAAGL